MQAVRQVLKTKGYSDAVVDIMICSTRKSTNKLYDTYIVQFKQFCLSQNKDFLHADVQTGLEFLCYLFNVKPRGYSVMNTARSALSQVIATGTSVSFGKHPDVVRFMQGIFNTKPPVPRYVDIWDPDKVLNLFLSWSPAQKLSLQLLTLKTLVLLLLVTSQRSQIIQKINISDMKVSKNSYQFYLMPQDIKQGRPNYKQEVVKISKYPINKKLCPYHYMECYLERVSQNRGTCESVFLTLSEPHKRPSQDTVSRWIKKVLKHAGIDISAYSAGSTRAASSSKAHKSGVAIDFILKKGGWTQSSTFGKYYKKPIHKDNDFAEGVLKL